MRKQKRRLVHYKIMSLNDGTVISGYPARKPTPNIIKRDKISVDEDGACMP